MEHTPFGSGPYEAPASSAEKSDKDAKKDKKKASPIEAPAVVDKKQKAHEDIARSLTKMPLFERPESSHEKPESSPEKPVEQLSPEETKHIQQETARDHLASIEQADERTAEELAPATEFLHKVAEGQDVEEAFHEAAVEAGLSEDEIAALVDAEKVDVETPEELDVAAEHDNELESPEDGVIDTSSTNEGVVNWRVASSGPVATGGNGGSGMPPRTSSTGAANPPIPPRPAGSTGSSNAAPIPHSATMASNAPNMLPARANAHYERRNKAGELLLIGLVGYLVGRRRGRIRAEKRLLPVQRKLEKQVKVLEQDITQKEQKLVAAKAEKRRLEARPVTAPVERMQPGRVETRIGMEKPVGERLGHMVVAAEAPRKLVKPEQSGTLSQVKANAESVQSMSRNELLEVSDKIIIEGASLRRVYESRLIGEKQLRHLVSEHLQGRDIRKDLRREMVEHEIDFERDPILRDRVRSKLAAKEGGGLGDMLAKAGITTDEVDPAFEKRVQQEQAREEAKMRTQHRKRMVADTAMATAIVILGTVVAILVFFR